MKESLTCTLCRSKIQREAYSSAEGMKQMLDVFLIGERITHAEYQELIALLPGEPTTPEAGTDTETGTEPEPTPTA